MTAHVKGSQQARNPWSVHAYQHLEKEQRQTLWGPLQVCFMAREQTGPCLRIIWQRKGLRGFRTHTHTHTLTFPGGTLLRGRMTVWGKEALCTWSETLACRALSGTQGTESREKSMVARLVRTESMVSSVSAKKRRTLTECLRTNLSVCHGQP